jgi:hypothetical protein
LFSVGFTYGYVSSTPFGVGKILFVFTVGFTYGYLSSTPFGVGKILFLSTVGFTYGYVSSTPFGVGKINTSLLDKAGAKTQHKTAPIRGW